MLGCCYLSTAEEWLFFRLSLNNPPHAPDYQFENTDIVIGYGECHCCHNLLAINFFIMAAKLSIFPGMKE